MNKISPQGKEISGADRQARQAIRSAESREENSLLALEQRGILPTVEFPVLYRALGKTGYGLFLYLEKGLDLQTLDLLAKCTERTNAITRCFASEKGP